MKKSINKTKLLATITAILLVATILQMAIPLQAQGEQPTHFGYVPEEVEGYPDLGPLPTGVTPDYSFETTAYLSFRPNPVGVGQSVLVNVWSTPGMYHAFYRYGYKVTIEKPDGNTIVVGPVNSYLGDASNWFEFVPDMAGTWRLKFEDPGTYIPAGNYTDRPGQEFGTGTRHIPPNTFPQWRSFWYMPSETDWQELEVQEDFVFSYPPADLPTDYWTRPINPANREWWTIAGNYPWTGVYYYPNGRQLYSSNYRYTPYVQGPNTAHILWKKQNGIGGLIGGDAYQYSLSDNPGTPTIIYSGRCYDTIEKVVDGEVVDVWQCYDLRTGEIYWERTGVREPQYISYDPPTAQNVPGAIASGGYSPDLVYIGASRLIKYDPWTGDTTLERSTSPISGGTFYKDPYVLTVQNLGGGHYRLINWTIQGNTDDFTERILSNITWPDVYGSLYDVDYEAGLSVRAACNSPNYGLYGGMEWFGPQVYIGYHIKAVDLYTGQVLFNINSTDSKTDSVQSGSTGVVNRGKVAFGSQNRYWSCFNARTGALEWRSELADYPWGNWWPYNVASYDFNESKSAIITHTYEGVYAIDWDDGSIIWHYQDPEAVPFENPYTAEDGSPATPFFTNVRIADGKVYISNGEHTQSQPRARDWKLHCINATTGEGLWSIIGSWSPGATADGYLTAGNSYDGYMYVFGKGESATTVTAPDVSVPLGTAMIIQGAVLDQSPGQPGTPCVSADSMSTQMEYLHMQQPLTGIWGNETITGVPVSLTAINQETNEVTDISTVTSNGYYGTFSYAWTPDEEGTYTIIASFNGDDSYGSSAAATAVNVGPAPEETQTPEPSPEQPEQPIISLEAALIIAVVVIAAVIILAWALMRRK